MNILKGANDAPTLASALNIAAFNIGNAMGAWVGGIVIEHGPGLNSISWVAALITAMGIGLSLVSTKLRTAMKQ